MADATQLRRQLKIKAGSAKRLNKESILYRKEAEDQKRKVDRLVSEGAEEWDVKNASRMLDESNRMIADASNRLGVVVGELRDLVVIAKKDPLIVESEEYLQAEEALEEAAV